MSPGEGHSASEPPTLSLAVPPPDALPSRNVTQGEEGQAGGGRKVYSICRVRREEEQVEGYLNKGWWGRSVTVESTMKKATTDLFFLKSFCPQMMNVINSVSRKCSVLIRFDRKTNSRIFCKFFFFLSDSFKIVHALVLPASAITFMWCL